MGKNDDQCFLNISSFQSLESKNFAFFWLYSDQTGINYQNSPLFI